MKDREVRNGDGKKPIGVSREKDLLARLCAICKPAHLTKKQWMDLAIKLWRKADEMGEEPGEGRSEFCFAE